MGRWWGGRRRVGFGGDAGVADGGALPRYSLARVLSCCRSWRARGAEGVWARGVTGNKYTSVSCDPCLFGF